MSGFVADSTVATDEYISAAERWEALINWYETDPARHGLSGLLQPQIDYWRSIDKFTSTDVDALHASMSNLEIAETAAATQGFKVHPEHGTTRPSVASQQTVQNAISSVKAGLGEAGKEAGGVGWR